jgi:hypothetical protein
MVEPANLEPASDASPTVERCVAHPEVAASVECRGCRSWTCETCDFVFPGDVHLCPKCVKSYATSTSAWRRRARNRSLVYGGVATAFFASLPLAGVLAESEAGLTVLGILAFGGGGGFALAGLAHGVDAIHRVSAPRLGERLPKIWSQVLIGLMVLISVIGTFSE